MYALIAVRQLMKEIRSVKTAERRLMKSLQRKKNLVKKNQSVLIAVRLLTKVMHSARAVEKA